MKDSIKAGELRLNNWVNYKGEPIQVTMIGEYGIQSRVEDCTINAKFQFDISPIPLSKEVLDRCGFVNDNGNLVFFLPDGIGVILYDEELNRCLVCVEIEGHYHNVSGMEYGFIHELQNAIWCLTGKELEITM